MRVSLRQKPTVSVLLLVTLMLLLAASWKVGDAICSDWTERRRVNNLTQKHIDDLLPAVERYRVALVVSGYVGRDELGQYATGSALASLQRRWDEMQTGDRAIGLTSLDYTSSDVLMYTESMAKLVTMVRWREAIYGPDGLEFSGPRAAGGLENVKFLLGSCGATMDDIVKVVVYMRDTSDFNKMDQVYREYFTKGQEPARVTIQALSPIEDIDIEIERICS